MRNNLTFAEDEAAKLPGETQPQCLCEQLPEEKLSGFWHFRSGLFGDLDRNETKDLRWVLDYWRSKEPGRFEEFASLYYGYFLAVIADQLKARKYVNECSASCITLLEPHIGVFVRTADIAGQQGMEKLRAFLRCLGGLYNRAEHAERAARHWQSLWEDSFRKILDVRRTADSSSLGYEVQVSDLLTALSSTNRERERLAKELESMQRTFQSATDTQLWHRYGQELQLRQLWGSTSEQFSHCAMLQRQLAAEAAVTKQLRKELLEAQQNHSVAEAKHGDADARELVCCSRLFGGALPPYEERYAQGAKDFVHKQVNDALKSQWNQFQEELELERKGWRKDAAEAIPLPLAREVLAAYADLWRCTSGQVPGRHRAQAERALRRLRDLDAYAVLLPPQDEMLQDWDPLEPLRRAVGEADAKSMAEALVEELQQCHTPAQKSKNDLSGWGATSTKSSHPRSHVPLRARTMIMASENRYPKESLGLAGRKRWKASAARVRGSPRLTITVMSDTNIVPLLAIYNLTKAASRTPGSWAHYSGYMLVNGARIFFRVQSYTICGRRPPYLSALIHELYRHKQTRELFIRVLYNGEVQKVCHGHGMGLLCPLEKWEELVARFTPSPEACPVLYAAYDFRAPRKEAMPSWHSWPPEDMSSKVTSRHKSQMRQRVLWLQLQRSVEHGRQCAHMAAECLRTSATLPGGTGPWTRILSFPKRHMFATNMLVSATLTPASDLFVQKQHGAPIDTCRLQGFFMLGVVQGVTSWLVYVSLFTRFFPLATRLVNLPLKDKFKDWPGLRQLCFQIAFDLAVYVPFVHFPVFYVAQGAAHGEDASSSLSRWRSNLMQDAAGGAAFWLPMDVLCFTVPMWLRMPIGYFTTFWYAALVSVFRGGELRASLEKEEMFEETSAGATCSPG
eukprot:s153_g6.t2